MSERPPPIDAAAIFCRTWNQFDFQQQVESDERIRIIHYDRACNSPKNIAEALSDLVGIALPAPSFTSECVQSPEASETELHAEMDQQKLDSFAGCPEF
jgi:hypothetical protein